MIGESASEPTEIVTDHLYVRFYRRDPRRVILIFASAGARRTDGYAEEFRGTFWSTGASLIFVADRHSLWFNYPDTEEVFSRIGKIAAEFAKVGVIGASLGACGAILFTNYADNIDRVVALAPQYSIFPPFINFDGRYLNCSVGVKTVVAFDYSVSPIKDRIALIYGNVVWQDYIHAAMFHAAGFRLSVLEGAPHNVAGHLKTAYQPNALRQLVDLFCDFDCAWSSDTLRRQLPVRWTDQALRPECRFAQEARDFATFSRNLAEPPTLPPPVHPIVSFGKTADQSSRSEWSSGQSTVDDAMGAVNGNISRRYSFHTGHEERAWWSVDLSDDYDIFAVRIFNRMDSFAVAKRNFNFRLESSRDGQEWDVLLEKEDDAYYGGADGRPYSHVFTPPRQLRHFRIVRLTPGTLHLNQVQLFGTPALVGGALMTPATSAVWLKD